MFESIKRVFLSLLLFSIQICFSQFSVDEYYQFLKKQNKSPKDYIFELFKTNDIIILGERDHRDTTQYDLILDIVKDKRFLEIGHIYTEVGVVNRTDWGNQIVKGKFKNEEAFHKEFVKLYRELDWNGLWDKYCMVKYLKGIYEINKNRSAKNKITIGFTDTPFDWEGMTREKYEAYNKKYLFPINTRDSIMAQNFIDLYEKQPLKNGRRKALYIQSRPHAEKLEAVIVSERVKKTGAYLRDKYGEKVKTIAFNWYNWVPADWQGNIWGYGHKEELSCDGKWDAAFELTGNKSVGFSIKDTPFGKTYYDYPYHNPKILRYEDIIDGFIFYLPFYKFTCARGIPNMVDMEFAKILIERFKIQGVYDENEDISPEEEMEDWEKFRGYECTDYKPMIDQMNKWLKK